jgi:DNA-binding transcriptional MerR regulator
MAEEEVFTLRGIVRKLRAAFHLSEDDEPSLSRAVRYWAAEGLLRPKGAVHTGRGRNRTFERDEVVRSGILFECSRWNLTVGTMKLLLNEVDKVKGRSTLLNFVRNLPRGTLQFTFVGGSRRCTIIDSGRKPIDSRSLLCIDLKKIANDLGL